MKLCLGSANFGTPYGAYKINKFAATDFDNIIKLSKKSNIKFLDTAENYKGTEKILSSKKFYNFKIITKVHIEDKNPNYLNNLEEKIIKLQKIFNHNLYAILIHNYEDLDIGKIENCFKILKKAKKKKIIKKFGISIYNFKRIKFLDKTSPDIIQAPFNIFDQRLLKNGMINFIYKKKIQLHIRSSFLQGTLVQKKLPKYLKKFKNEYDEWFEYCQKKKIDPLRGCIDFIKQYKNKISFLVVGFNAPKELLDIVKKYKISTKVSKKSYKQFSKTNINLIDPRKWKK